MKDWLIVIPARLESTRLPRKLLQVVEGKPLLVHTWENIKPLEKLGAELLVAADAQEIIKVCQSFKVEAVLTNDSHQSGTDRVYEVAAKRAHPFVLNVQGDEPNICLDDLKSLMATMNKEPEPDVATLAYESSDIEDFNNSNVVKVVKGGQNQALYFSRSAIPFNRDNQANFTFWQHIGVYAYRREALERFCQLPHSPLESLERLEQLRALEAGMHISVVSAQSLTHGIDTPEDLERYRKHVSR